MKIQQTTLRKKCFPNKQFTNIVKRRRKIVKIGKSVQPSMSSFRQNAKYDMHETFMLYNDIVSEYIISRRAFDIYKHGKNIAFFKSSKLLFVASENSKAFGRFAIEMPYFSRGTLCDLIKSPPSEKRDYNITFCIICTIHAIACMNEIGINHNDVKTNNVFLEDINTSMFKGKRLKDFTHIEIKVSETKSFIFETKYLSVVPKIGDFGLASLFTLKGNVINEMTLRMSGIYGFHTYFSDTYDVTFFAISVVYSHFKTISHLSVVRQIIQFFNANCASRNMMNSIGKKDIYHIDKKFFNATVTPKNLLNYITWDIKKTGECLCIADLGKSADDITFSTFQATSDFFTSVYVNDLNLKTMFEVGITMMKLFDPVHPKVFYNLCCLFLNVVSDNTSIHPLDWVDIMAACVWVIHGKFDLIVRDGIKNDSEEEYAFFIIDKLIGFYTSSNDVKLGHTDFLKMLDVVRKYEFRYYIFDENIPQNNNDILTYVSSTSSFNYLLIT